MQVLREWISRRRWERFWPAQGLQLADHVRLVAFEGEPLCVIGRAIESAWPDGLTFPLGYCHGEAPYLPNTAQLAEGGYESTGCREFGLPGEFKPGTEAHVSHAIENILAAGIP